MNLAARLLLPATVLLASAACAQQDAAATRLSPGLDYYGQYCASCHGPAMEGAGANGGALRGADLQWGSSREDLFRNISEGIPDMGMPSYRDGLTPEQINQIVDAILGTETPVVSASTAPAVRERDQVKTLDYEVKVDVWVDGVETPWGIDFINERWALITEKAGPLRVVIDGKLHPEPIKGTPAVNSEGQGGMMDVAIDPEYDKNGWIYLAYTHALPSDSKRTLTRVVRGRIDQHAWQDEQVVWEGKPEMYSTRRLHYGTRIVFDDDGMLYFCIGERGQQELSQRVDLPNGKVFRLHRDGAIPDDNPYQGVEGALPGIFSHGHRNQQGLSFHPVTRELYGIEHGPRGGDELNIVRPGRNYGWPLITYGINYNGTLVTRERSRPGLEQPIWYWRPSLGVSGLEFYTGDEFPYWRNHLLAASLVNETLRLLRVEEGRVIHEEVILQGKGRIREAITGPDGAIYAVMNTPNEILRLTSLGETKY